MFQPLKSFEHIAYTGIPRFVATSKKSSRIAAG
jgi:hypothetical protein